jgi:hypothetical protein
MAKGHAIGTVKKGEMPGLDAAIEAAIVKAEESLSKPDMINGVAPGSGSATAPGMTRICIVSLEHTDGKAKKTWKRGSVIEIDQYTAKRMIENLKCAYPTDEPLNEILVEYKGK